MDLAALDLQLKCALRARGCRKDFANSQGEQSDHEVTCSKDYLQQLDPAPRCNSRRKEKVEAGCASIAVAAGSNSRAHRKL